MNNNVNTPSTGIADVSADDNAQGCSINFCQAFLDCLPQQVFYKDAQGVYRACNQRFAASVGLDVQAVIGKRDTDLYPPELARNYQASDLPVLEQGITVDMEYKYRSGGETRFVHVWKSPIRDANGDVHGIFAIFYDITEQRRAEHQAQSLAKYARSLIEASLDPLVMISPDGKITDVNRAAELSIGLTREHLIGTDFCDYFTEPDQVRESYQRILFEGTVKGYPLTLRHVSGAVVEVLYNATVYRNASGQIEGIFGAIRDITELRRSQTALEKAKEDLEASSAEVQRLYTNLEQRAKDLEDRHRQMAILGSMSDFLQSCQSIEESYQIIEVAMKQLFPTSSGGFYIFKESGNFLENVSAWGDHPPTDLVFAPQACWAIRRGRLHLVIGSRLEPRCYHVSEEKRPYLCAPMMAQGQALGILYLTLDPELADDEHRLKTRQRVVEAAADRIGLGFANLKLRETLRSLSVRDPLTGLFNRRFMEETLELELKRMERHLASLCVVVLDVDHFKKFNDTFGHDAGDALLRELAIRLQQSVRTSDVVCRFGGEEFVLILPGTPLETALERMDQLRTNVSQIALSYAGQLLGKVTVSIGVACYPDHGATADALIAAADAALYQAKTQGRDCIRVADYPREEYYDFGRDDLVDHDPRRA